MRSALEVSSVPGAGRLRRVWKHNCPVERRPSALKVPPHSAVYFYRACRWCDPMGANLISIVIIYRWTGIISEQARATAPRSRKQARQFLVP